MIDDVVAQRHRFGHGTFAHRKEVDPPCLRVTRMVRGCIDSRRLDPRFGQKRGQPTADLLSLLGPFDHIKNHNHRLARGASGGKEFSHSSIVVFLLREHCHKYIARIANTFGSLPVGAQRTVDVGRVEEYEPS